MPVHNIGSLLFEFAPDTSPPLWRPSHAKVWEYALDIKLAFTCAGVNDGLLIEIDGGVGVGNAGALLQAGADVLVAGSSVFAAANPTQSIADLKAVDIQLKNI